MKNVKNLVGQLGDSTNNIILVKNFIILWLINKRSVLGQYGIFYLKEEMLI